jgi:hypothetical protein
VWSSTAALAWSCSDVKKSACPCAYFVLRNIVGRTPDERISSRSTGLRTAPSSIVMNTYGRSVSIRFTIGALPSVVGGTLACGVP